MTCVRCFLTAFLGSLLFSSVLIAQQPNTTQSSAIVPRLVNFSGKATDVHGRVISGVAGATFAIYKDQYEGAALWTETQNIRPDADGNYTVQLGATKSEGVPLELFTTSEARWLGVRINNGEEQPRVLLVSVPYALKAADADTLGGKPLSAFQLAPESSGGATNNASASEPQPAFGEQANEIVCSSTTACGAGFIPEFSTTGGSSKVVNSLISQSGTTVTISGSDTITGNESVSGTITGKSVTGSTGVVGTSSTTGDAILGENTGGGIGVHGASFVAGGSPAIWGENFATSGGIADGVHGVAHSAGSSGAAGVNVAGGIGVFGTTGGSSAGNTAGVYGNVVSPSATGFVFTQAGVWGDTSDGIGVLGTTSNGQAGYFFSGGGPSGQFALNAVSLSSTQPLFLASNFGTGKACTIDAQSNLSCNGSKSAVVPVDNGTRKVALYAIESPENWFEDIGGARLSGGAATVHLEPTFAQTVNTDLDYRVFLTPNGDCLGLYVTHKTANSFEVHELGGGTSDISFDYRIIAKRKGYENVRLADKTKEFEAPKLPRRPGSSAPAAAEPKNPQ